MAESGDLIDIDISNECQNSSDQYFYNIIGCIEDILLDDRFVQLHSNFMEQYWIHFEEQDENKFIYSDIFRKYNETIEKYIEDQLMKQVDNFDMNRLEEELKKRENELDGEIFEILSTFTNFLAFKEKFLDYKAMKEGKVMDLSKHFIISKYEAETAF
ncbi:hypothetical protein PPYR_08284 [Photinus pyralis]|uniref:ADP-ribosylation factor-like protein 2-binding protein n=1 Tax=Photinus pyralis TaxID=7054 RepID=A0A1Y1MF98_PHOPY|nr:ADP-ribosylation factor-like protein 2-binding protein [Photinus pyralis]KAB0797290.1 hypothetical protein PPYR_08284 [Photinus pyralis]